MRAFWIINAVIFFMLAWSLLCKKEARIKPMDRENTSSLRGILMLLMISHHICAGLGNREDILVRVLATLGGMLTGVYFLLSGYGNYMSLQRNGEIDLRWLAKRVWSIILPFELCYPFFYILSGKQGGG